MQRDSNTLPDYLESTIPRYTPGAFATPVPETLPNVRPNHTRYYPTARSNNTSRMLSANYYANSRTMKSPRLLPSLNASSTIPIKSTSRGPATKTQRVHLQINRPTPPPPRIFSWSTKSRAPKYRSKRNRSRKSSTNGAGSGQNDYDSHQKGEVAIKNASASSQAASSSSSPTRRGKHRKRDKHLTELDRAQRVWEVEHRSQLAHEIDGGQSTAMLARPTTPQSKVQCLEYLNHPMLCRMFSEVKDKETVMFDFDEIDELYTTGGAGKDTYVYIKALNDAGRKFQSKTELVNAIKEAYLTAVQRTEKEMKMRLVTKDERRQIVALLTHPECELFKDAEYIQVTPDELSRLIVEAGGLEEAVQHLQHLGRLGRRFDTFAHLIFAVTAAEMARRSSVGALQEILTFLNSRPCRLFSGLRISMEDVTKIYDEGTAGIDTMIHLKALNQLNRRFNTLDGLIAVLTEMQLDLVRRRRTYFLTDFTPITDLQRDELLEYLTDPTFGLFSEAKQIEIGREELTLLLSEGRSVESTKHYLRKLDNDGRKFFQVDDLILAVKAQHLQTKKELMSYLNRESNLFSDEIKAGFRLDMDRMDYIMSQGRIGPGTVTCLRMFDDEGRHFHSLEAMLIALKTEHIEKLRTQMQEKLAALSFLSSPECKLLPRDFAVSENEMSRLFEEGGSDTVLYLEELDEDAQTIPAYVNLPSLKRAIGHQRKCDDVRRTEILGHLRSAKSSLVVDEHAGKKPISARDAARLYREAKAGRDTLSYLWEFDVAGTKFSSVDALIEAVKDAHFIAKDRQTAGRRLLVQYLSSPQCSLFGPNNPTASDSQLDAIIHAGRNAFATLSYLQYIEAWGTECRDATAWTSVNELLEAVKQADARSNVDRKEILAFFLSSNSNLFTQDNSGSLVTFADADRLYVEGGAGPDTLFYLQQLSDENVATWIIEDEHGVPTGLGPCQRRGFNDLGDITFALKHHHLATQALARRILPRVKGDECLLFSTLTEGGSSVQDEITTYDIKRLLTITSAGKRVLAHLDILETSIRKQERSPFTSFDILINTVNEMHSQMIKFRNQSLRALRSRLIQPECPLFPTGSEMEWSAVDVERLYIAAAGMGTSFMVPLGTDVIIGTASSSSKYQDQKLPDVGQMVKVSTGFVDILRIADLPDANAADTFLNDLERQVHVSGNTFGSPDELLQAVDKHARVALTKKKEIFDYLNSQDCILIQDATTADLTVQEEGKSSSEEGKYNDIVVSSHKRAWEEAQVSMRDVDQLYLEGGAGVETLNRLLKLETRPTVQTCTSIEELIKQVQAEQKLAEEANVQAKGRILNFLRNPDCFLLAAQVKVRQFDMTRLLYAGGTGTNSLVLLRQLNQEKPLYFTFNELVQGVKSTYSRTDIIRQDLLSYLSGPGRTLFANAPYIRRFHPFDMVRLYSEGNAGNETLTYLKQLSKEQKEFACLDDLIGEVKARYTASQKVLEDEKFDTLLYLRGQSTVGADSPCDLFVDVTYGMGLNFSDVRRLHAESGAGRNTLMYLREMNKYGSQYKDLGELILALRSHHLLHKEQVSELLAHFSHPKCKLFSESPITINFTVEDAERILNESGAGSNTLHHIWRFDVEGKRFSFVNELIQALQRAEQEDRRKYKQEMDLILQHLKSSECTLFVSGIDFQMTSHELDLLFEAGGRNGLNVVFFLQQLEQGGYQYARAGPLIIHVRKLAAKIQIERKELFQYINGPSCHIFDGSEVNAKNESKSSSSSSSSSPSSSSSSSESSSSLSTAAGSTSSVSSTDTGVTRLNATDVFQLYTESTAGSVTLLHLKALEDEHYRASNLSSLIRTIQERHNQLLERRSRLWALLTDSACKVLTSKCKDSLRPGDIQPIMEVADPYAQECVEEVQNAGDGYSNLEDLSDAVALMLEQRQKIKKEVWTYLTSPQCTLFPPHAPLDIREKDVELLLAEAGAGSMTKLHLWSLAAESRTFTRLDDLIEAVAMYHRDEMALEQAGPRTFGAKLQHFTSKQLHEKQVKASQRSLATSNGLAPGLKSRMAGTNVGLDTAFVLTESDRSLLFEAGRTGRADLDLAVKAGVFEAKEKKRELIDWLKRPDCRLFEDAAHIEAMEEATSAAGIDQLYFGTGIEADTLRILQKFEREGQQFSSFTALVEQLQNVGELERASHRLAQLMKLAEVREEVGQVEMSPEDRKEVIDYLNSPECSLFSEVNANQREMITSNDLDSLIKLSKSAEIAVFHLKQLDQQGRKVDSFSTLLPAMWVQHEAFNARCKDVLRYLFSPQSKCVSRRRDKSDLADVSMLDIQNLIVRGGAGMDTLPLLVQFDQSGVQFTGIAMLEAAVKAESKPGEQGALIEYKAMVDLEAEAEQKAMLLQEEKRLAALEERRAMQRAIRLEEETARQKRAIRKLEEENKAKDQAAADALMDFVSEGDRTGLSTYLTSPECRLFSEVGQDDLELTRIGLNRVLRRQGLAKTLANFRYLDELKEKFYSFADAGLAIKEMTDRKDELLEWLLRPELGLFRKASQPVTITVEEIDRIYKDSHARNRTLYYLKRFEAEARRFETIDALVQGIREEQKKEDKKKAEKDRKFAKEAVLTFLSKPGCYLFPGSGKENETKMHVTDAQLDALVDRSGGNMSEALAILTEFQNTNKYFNSLEGLVAAVRGAYMPPKIVTSEENRWVFDHIRSENFNLISNVGEVWISDFGLRRLVKAAGGGREAIVMLVKMQQNGSKFSSFEDLIRAAEKAKRIDSVPDPPTLEEKMQVFHYLKQADCKLFAQGRVTVTDHSLTRLVEAAGSVEDCLHLLDAFNVSGRQFLNVRQLAEAVQFATSPSKPRTEIPKEEKKRVYAYLSSEDSNLFVGVEEMTVTEMGICQLIDAAGSSEAALDILRSFDAAEMGFTSFDNLVLAVKSAAIPKFVSTKEEKQMVYNYLTGVRPPCMLFAGEGNIQISAHGLGKIVDVASEGRGGNVGGARAVKILKQFDEEGRHFTSFDELVAAVIKFVNMPKKPEPTKEQTDMVFRYLQREGELKLFAGAGIVRITRSGLSKMLIAAGGDTEALITRLRSMENQGYHFRDFNELVLQVRADLNAMTPREEKEYVHNFIISPKCSLFSGAGHIAIPAPRLAHLIFIGGGALRTRQLMVRYCKEGRKYNDFEELITDFEKESPEEVKQPQPVEIPAEARGDVAKVVDTLKQLTSMFQTNASTVKTDSSDIVSLIKLSDNDPDLCIFYLRQIRASGKTFPSVSSLLPAIQQTRTADRERKVELLDMLCDSKRCPFWEPAPPPMKIADVDNLVLESGFNNSEVARSVQVLSKLDTKFSSLAELLVFLQVKYRAVHAVMRWIDSPKCKLFRGPPHIHLSQDALHEIVEAVGGDERDAVKVLQGMNRQPKRFSSFHELVDTIRDQGGSPENVHVTPIFDQPLDLDEVYKTAIPIDTKEQKASDQSLTLGSTDQQSVDQNDGIIPGSPEDKLSYQQGVTTATSEEMEKILQAFRHPKVASILNPNGATLPEELSALMAAAGGHPDKVAYYLRQLANQSKKDAKYKTVPSLTEAVDSLRHRFEGDDYPRLQNVLRKPRVDGGGGGLSRSELLPKSVRDQLYLPVVELVAVESGMSPTVAAENLERMATMGEKFSSLKDLVKPLAERFRGKEILRATLTAKNVALWEPPIADLELSHKALETMLDTKGGKDGAILFLKALVRQKKTFSSVQSLLAAFTERIPIEEISRVVNYINQCQMLVGEPKSQEVALLIPLLGGTNETLSICRVLNNKDNKFENWQQLAMAAINNVTNANNDMKIPDEATNDLLVCIGNWQLVQMDRVSIASLHNVFRAGRSIDATFLYLHELHIHQRQFKTMEELAEAVTKADLRASERKQQVLDFLASPECLMFSSAAIPTRMDHMDRLWVEGGEVSSFVLPTLKAFNEEKRTFASLDGLVAAVKSDKIAPLFEFILSEECTLYQDHVGHITIAVPGWLDIITSHDGSAEKAMDTVRALNAQGRRFNTFEALVQACKVEAAQNTDK